MAKQPIVGPAVLARGFIGRSMYGFAAIALGTCAIAWQSGDIWQPINGLSDAPIHQAFAIIVGSIEILGGAAMLSPRTARWGAIALGAIAFLLTVLGLPLVFAQPLVYNGYGNVFDQLSLVSAALVLFASLSPDASSTFDGIAKIGYVLFAVCVVSFGLEQLFYLPQTASLVPKWLPPGQLFWAIATTIAFFLAAIAMLTGCLARLASQLTTAMLASFGVIVWLPILFADSHSIPHWTEAVETFAIAASAWVITDYLSSRSLSKP